MASWITLANSRNLPFVVASEPLLLGLKPFLSGAKIAANTAAGVLGALALIMAGTNDPMSNLRADIDALINDLVNAGVFSLVIKPELRNRSGLTGIDGFGRVLKSSFADEGDLNRPQFGTGDDTEGVVFLISSPSFVELSDLAKLVQILFGDLWNELIAAVTSKGNNLPIKRVEGNGSVTDLPSGTDPKKVFKDDSQGFEFTNGSLDPYRGQRISFLTGRNAGLSSRVDSFNVDTRTFTTQGYRYDLKVGDRYALNFIARAQPPDWQSIKIVEAVPIVSLATEALASLRDMLPIGGQNEFLNNLVALIEAKAALFGQLEGVIDEIILLFDRLKEVPEIAMLPVPPQNQGNHGFVREYFNASNPPTVGSGDFTMGVVLYGGQGVYSLLQKIFPLP